MFTGTLRNREAVCYIRRGEYVTYDTLSGAGGLDASARKAAAFGEQAESAVSNKVAQIRRIAGAKTEDSGIVHGGDSAVVLGLTDARAGDLVVTGGANITTKSRVMAGDLMAAGSANITAKGFVAIGDNRKLEARLQAFHKLRLAEPLFSVKVFAGDGLENKLLRAVREFADEDPLLEYEWIPDERELVLKVMGKIQLEIMEAQFLERYGIGVRFSPPTVIYKETPRGAGIGFEAYTMPKPCWAVVQLAIEPLRRGAGYSFESVIKAKVLPYPYQRHVELTVPQALKQGMYNWEVTDIKVTLIGGEHHHVHTHPMDFFLATPIAVMDGLRNAGTVLLEPLALMRMTAPESLAGRIIGDVTSMRGSFDSPVISRGNFSVEALLPVSESLEYPVRFSSYTSGRGVMKTSFAGYRECPVEFGAVAERRGINPLDRMRWILHKRNALS